MNYTNLTIKAREIIENATLIALQNSNQAVEDVHIMKAILLNDTVIIPFIFQKLNVNFNIIQTSTE